MSIMALGPICKRSALLLALVCAPALGAEYYVIDPEHTFSVFEYSHWGLSQQRGRFDGNSGSITIDQEAKTADIHIEIDAASISTGSSMLDDMLRSVDFFDVEHYPSIVFKSTRVQFDQGRMVEVEGDLSIKDVTRRVVMKISNFNCRFMIIYGKRACGANGVATLSRTEFDLGRYVPFISDQVSLYITVEAIQKE
jgi:polyisoprenoid-binding protein YceI